MANNSLLLMDAGRVKRSLKRIAHQIVEVNKKDRPIILLGINQRGYLIANKLTTYLSGICSSQVKSLQLMADINEGGKLNFEAAGFENAFLVLVDDVIFSGTTMFNALKLLSKHLDLKEIHTVVLIDRGHRKLPVDAQFVGMDLPTKLNEHVSLIVEKDDIQGVKLSTD